MEKAGAVFPPGVPEAAQVVAGVGHGEDVEVGREEDPASGPLLRLAVRDTGIGIPDDKREVIFERFTQIDAGAGRKYGGVGLGLAICKKLAELMGGRIGVESAPDQGSTFTLTLPLRPAPMPRDSAQ